MRKNEKKEIGLVILLLSIILIVEINGPILSQTPKTLTTILAILSAGIGIIILHKGE